LAFSRVVVSAALLVLASALMRAEGFPRTVTDDRGQKLVLPRAPVRIASLTLPSDEILLSLTARERIIMVTSFAADARLSWISPLVAGMRTAPEVNVEELISLSPDLVVVADWSDAGKVAQLRSAGVPVYVAGSARGVEAVAEKIRRLARVTGDEARGAAIVAEMRARLQAVARKVAAVPAARRPRILDYSSWGGAMGRGSTWDEVVRLAGLVNAAGPLAADSWGQVPLSREKLLELDPDILALPGWLYGKGNDPDRFAAEVASDPALRLLKAVRGGRVFRIPGPVQETSSQYIAAAVEWLARSAYPELFK
jgi:iron complex transport system substrate-binding protein